MSSGKKPSGPGARKDKTESGGATSKEDSPIPKDEAASASGGSNGAPSAEPSAPSSKPGSAGASAREAAQKILANATKGEWPPVDQLLKNLEKSVQAALAAGDDAHVTPLAGVMDPVSSIFRKNLSAVEKLIDKDLPKFRQFCQNDETPRE